jgi:hypothetical protein
MVLAVRMIQLDFLRSLVTFFYPCAKLHLLEVIFATHRKHDI